MTAQTLIKIGDQTVDAARVEVPASRKFRDAWVLDGSVIGIDPAKRGVALAKMAAAECERRLAEGKVLSAATVSPGTVFRCDDSSINRLHAALQRAERREAQSKSVNVKFRTHGGVVIQCSSVAEIGAIYDEVTAYPEDLLAASSDLQGQCLAGTFTGDVTTWAGWPSAS